MQKKTSHLRFKFCELPAGGCGRGRVPDYMTPSVIPFWNRLTKCSLNLYQKNLKNYKLKDFFFRIYYVICEI